MNNAYLEISYWQVAAAGLLILINAGLSFALALGLGRTIAIATLRTVLQLSLIGLILDQIFALQQWYFVAAIAIVMTLIAGLSAVGRIKQQYSGIRINTIVSIFASSWFVTAFALFIVLQGRRQWYDPQYAIPLLGMVLGNTLNGISVGLNSFTSSLRAQQGMIETNLCLGATRFEALRPVIADSIRDGLTPIFNSMMIVGLVSLPGMMTGQLISGMDPIQAVKYQIVIMFMIASATILGTVFVVMLSYAKLTRPHRLESESMFERR